MKATITRFLTLFAEAPETRSGSPPAQYLGELFCALQHLQDVEVEEIEEDPPAPDKHSLRQEVEAAFPSLGLYPGVDSSNPPGEARLLTRDSVGDLVEILTVLHEAEWRWNNTSESDALWNLRFEFESHLSERLLSLLKHFDDRRRVAGSTPERHHNQAASLLALLEGLPHLTGLRTEVRASGTAVRVRLPSRGLSAASDAHDSQRANKTAAILSLLAEIADAEFGGGR